MKTLLFFLLILYSVIFGIKVVESELVQDFKKLEGAIDRFCGGRSGRESPFCLDYSELRTARDAAAPPPPILANSTVSPIVGSAAVSSNKQLEAMTIEGQNPKPKGNIGDVVLTEGNTTTVLHKSAEIEKEDELHPKNVMGPPEPSGVQLTAQEIREELRRIIQEEYMKQGLTSGKDDPACSKLRPEYDEVCFATPPLAAFQETREFCLAFVKNCQKSLLTNLFTSLKNFKVDFTAYCKKHKERFRYVCPDPLRFFSFAQDAVEFCVRYKERCPKNEVPAEPVPFKRKDADHIYTREIEFWCTREKRTAYNYCTEPDLLRTPRYMKFCGFYKYACIDILQRVIYG